MQQGLCVCVCVRGGWGGGGCCEPPVEESPGGGCEEVWEKCVLWLVVTDYLFIIFWKIFFNSRLYFWDLYLTILCLSCLLYIFYWFIDLLIAGWCCLYHNDTYNANNMISSLFYTLSLFQSELVLECILISATSILHSLWQVLNFFDLPRPLKSLLWKIVSETELGKKLAKLNWGKSHLMVTHNTSLNPV